MIVFKAIKPSRLQDAKMRLTLLNAMRKSGTAIRRDFQRTTATWEHKPTFEILVSLTGGGPTVLVATDDKIYRFVNDGTRPHLILPKTAKMLAFPSGYQAKTVPRILDSRAGGSYGDAVFARAVQHPGTEARHFDEMIQRAWEPKFKQQMEEAMRQAAKDSGHGG